MPFMPVIAVRRVVRCSVRPRPTATCSGTKSANGPDGAFWHTAERAGLVGPDRHHMVRAVVAHEVLRGGPLGATVRRR